MLNPLIQETYSEKQYNEDVFCLGSDYAMVLDGASGLDKANRMQTGSDARWFVEQMMRAIQKNIHSNQTLKQIVKEAIQSLIPLYPIVEKQYMPSGCLSLIRCKEDTIEYIGFGDCVALFELKNEILCLYDHNIEKLDNLALQSKDPYPILLENRNLRNEPNGYCALDLTFKSLDMCIEQTFKKEDVRSIALMSDGFYQLKQLLQLDSSCFIQTLYEQKEKALPLLYSLQEQDWPCQILPRFKKRDDTTVLFFTL